MTVITYKQHFTYCHFLQDLAKNKLNLMHFVTHFEVALIVVQFFSGTRAQIAIVIIAKHRFGYCLIRSTNAINETENVCLYLSTLQRKLKRK